MPSKAAEPSYTSTCKHTAFPTEVSGISLGLSKHSFELRISLLQKMKEGEVCIEANPLYTAMAYKILTFSTLIFGCFDLQCQYYSVGLIFIDLPGFVCCIINPFYSLLLHCGLVCEPSPLFSLSLTSFMCPLVR